MRKVVSFINCSAARVPWGMRERSAEVTNLIAGQRAHGAASVFYTCAPDDVHTDTHTDTDTECCDQIRIRIRCHYSQPELCG